MERSKRVIVWFRNDLRLHDNESLTDAIETGADILPVYIFDDRIFKGKTSFGFDKCGSFRTKFIIESVADLRKNLRDRGADLIVRIGKPEDILFDLANSLKTNWIFCNRERTSEEVTVQDSLEQKLWTIGQELRFARGKMLYYTADLPFPVNQTPDTFTHFRKEVERFVAVRPPLETPDSIKYLNAGIQPGAIPELTDFGKLPVTKQHIENIKFTGGETAGLAQLQYYINETGLVKKYKETRNELLGWDYSSKLSAWLATGCVSPKMIYAVLSRFESEVMKNESTYWLFFELMWRDFFRLMGKKHGSNIFRFEGTRHIQIKGEINFDKFEDWATGNTGIPFVDANMRQLNATGFMSNRGRQNVASFLVKDMGVNWLMGAEYFESLLIDYDPCSNYGNWNYVAGVGSDPREDRYFNVQVQAKKYDPEAKFVKYWVPEVQEIPAVMLYERVWDYGKVTEKQSC